MKNETTIEINRDNGYFTVDRQSIVTISASEITINPEPDKCDRQS
mgnify:CR=1 FL=1